MPRLKRRTLALFGLYFLSVLGFLMVYRQITSGFIYEIKVMSDEDFKRQYWVR